MVRWLEELPHLNELRISWYFTQVSAASYEIHCFADTSLLANSACSYLCIIDTKNFVHCSFLLGKSIRLRNMFVAFLSKIFI